MSLDDRDNVMEKLLFLSQQVESFVVSIYPTISSPAAEDQEVILLKLAHNFFPEVNIEHYSLGVSPCNNSIIKPHPL